MDSEKCILGAENKPFRMSLSNSFNIARWNTGIPSAFQQVFD